MQGLATINMLHENFHNKIFSRRYFPNGALLMCN